MCGIAGIVIKEQGIVNPCETIAAMSALLKHRGPDGDGFMTVLNGEAISYSGTVELNYNKPDLVYLPNKSLSFADKNSTIAFAHRRLSIIDLSETGHQPMCSADKTIWITYNGELYNYKELRVTLQKAGYKFVSESDTEVILYAYKEWGNKCVEVFNGMWAFCIYDATKQALFASRDRLGVKPFYYLNKPDSFSFASEQKAFIGSGLIKANVDEKALHSYLINGLLENERSNFFNGITELWPGDCLNYNLKTNELSTYSYFNLNSLVNLSNDGLSDTELIEKITQTLETAIRLRLRSHVEVGTCLSGGIDSSVLALLMANESSRPVSCFTSIFKNQPFNEEVFSDIVAKKINGKHLKVEPTLEGFLNEADNLIYSQDVPIWSTSTYAQYKVMELAKLNNIKVVLDGQGADELFGGYHHHFVAKWNNLLSKGKIGEAISEIKMSSKSIPHPFVFYLKQKVKEHYNFSITDFNLILNKDFVESAKINNSAKGFNELNEQLIHDIYDTRLKTFLKCEDRCGMWHSVESRTPFSDDIDLMKLLFSFNANRKIQKGISKYLLREAAKAKLPEQIYSRYDKKGFETPMQDWMIKMRPRVLAEIKNAGFDFVNYNKLESGNPDSVSQNALLFKLFVLARWYRVFK